MKPTFVVIGAAKAGTTTLCHLLGQHPEVFFTPSKELHFFSFDETFARGEEWYESNFAGAEGQKHIGEGSATYSARALFPHTARRMAEYAPKTRLIYIVRHPLDRMVSTWLQLRHFRSECPFRHVGLDEVPEGMRVDPSFSRAVRLQADAIVESTNYWKEIGAYRSYFPDEQILVITFEDLKRDPQAVIQRCCDFLSIGSMPESVEYSTHLNPTGGRRLARGFLWRFWSTPRRRALYTKITVALPQPVRDAFSGLLTTPATSMLPEWDPQTRAWALERLGDDLSKFLDFYGYPADTWALSPA